MSFSTSTVYRMKNDTLYITFSKKKLNVSKLVNREGIRLTLPEFKLLIDATKASLKQQSSENTAADATTHLQTKEYNGSKET